MSAPRKQAVSVAIAWRSGLIQFTRPGRVPEGAIIIAGGPPRKLRDIVEVNARHGYGRTHGKLLLLVPGVPEAESDNDAVDALGAFSKRVKHALKRSTVEGARHESL